VEQKFVNLEEAIKKLDISSELLNQLRERGELRAYRDGSSWKFRADEIERLVIEGIPKPSPESDIGLASYEDLVEAEPLTALPDVADDLTLAPVTNDSTDQPSDINIQSSTFEGSDLDDTVPADGNDLVLGSENEGDENEQGGDEGSDPSDSILLSEEALGDSEVGSASTIIGKNELEESDLKLAPDQSSIAADSDVKLASSGASHVLSQASSDSDNVLDDARGSANTGKAFEDLDELEIDLEAESSRILQPDDVAQSQPKGADKPASSGQKENSDLHLNDIEQATSDDDSAPTKMSSMELDLSSSIGGENALKPEPSGNDGSESGIDLSIDDDSFVLADSGGEIGSSSSDLSLDAAESGINLVAPSDSGLALDDIPLEMGGSAILDSLSLGGESSIEGPDSEISLVASDSSTSTEEPLAELQTDDDFQLTPMGEADGDSDDSSSQVIALDESLGDLGGLDEEGGLGEAASGLLGEDDLMEDLGEAIVLEPDQEEDAAAAVSAASYPTAVSPGDYTLWNILSLGACVMLLTLGTVMMLDMVRNIWSWGETYALNSALLDGLLGIFGLSGS
jgi:hypothetical protein